MDIKSKSISYSKGLKILAIIVICVSVIALAGTATFYYFFNDEINMDTYYETYKFEKEFGSLVHNVVELNVVLKDVENIKASGDEEWEKRNNIERLKTINNKLLNLVNFVYFIRNTETDKFVTNVENINPISYIEKQSNSVYLDQSQTADICYNYDIEQMLADTPYVVYAAVVEPMESGDVFYEEYKDYIKVNNYTDTAITLSIISFIVLIITLIYLVYVAGRKTKYGDINLLFVDRIYLDFHAVIVLILAIISVLFTVEAYEYIFYNKDDAIITIIVIGMVLCVDILIGLNFILSITRVLKSGQFISRTLLYRIYNGLKSFCINCFNGKIFKPWILIMLLGYALINSIMFFILLNMYSFGSLVVIFIIIAFNGFIIYFVAKALQSLKEIMIATGEIAEGNLDYELDLTKNSIVFIKFAEKIHSIRGGMKKAVGEAVKGEHLKTALITNVSHDLKTPLTSIITYVDLLKNENLNNEKVNGYISILEEKSNRLKHLIEDLIEASKASSGNIDVQKERVDLNELIHQAIGEYQEKFNKAELDVHFKSIEDTLILADGKYMWRIVENLFSNFVKYSLSKTRIYISVEEKNHYGILTIKNISAFPLNISSEELTERFVRGDESRTTEGSGLGLSIAESLTKIQAGKFNIEIDGDLFKVIVEIPLWS